VEKELPSGRTLVVSIAPFPAASKLRKIIAAELLKVEINVGKLDLNLDIKNLDPRALNTLKNVVCLLLSSDAVEAGFFECAARCTIDGAAIKRDSFDHEQSRQDFIPCAWEVIRANLAPFFASLDLSSLTSAPAKSAAPT
jgi:hypothetical protein